MTDSPLVPDLGDVPEDDEAELPDAQTTDPTPEDVAALTEGDA